MAVIVQTPSPPGLLSAIRKAIAQGHIRTWTCDKDGDLTHTPEQWRGQAWLRPSINAGILKCGFIGNSNAKTSKALYGVYHGRWIEELLTHFDTEMTSNLATPLPVSGVDKITA